MSTAIRCKDYLAVELYLIEGGNPDGFYGMTLLGKNLQKCCFCSVIKIVHFLWKQNSKSCHTAGNNMQQDTVQSQTDLVYAVT